MHITTPHLGSYRSHSTDSDFNNRHSSAAQSAATNLSTNVAPTTIAPVDATAAVAKPAFDSEAVAKNILSFVQQRLSKAAEQGASKDQLTALLAQAREGVASGFGQAVGQLKDTGALTDTLSSAISSALQKVDSGLDDLAKQLGLAASTASSKAPTTTSSTAVDTSINTAPAPQTGTLTQLAAAYRASFSSKQSVDLVVKTADGDTVHLQLGLREKQTISAAYQGNANGQQLTLSSSQKSSAGLSISVDGNLDSGELQALSDLLDKVGNLADSFFSGDVAGALQQASTLDFSNPELNSFSLDLHSEVTAKAKVAAYAAVQSLGSDASSDNSTASSSTASPSTSSAPATSTPTSSGLADLAKALSSLVPNASLADNPASLLKQLLAAQLGANDQQNNPLLNFANRLLTALGADGSIAPSTDNSSAAVASADTSTSTAAA